MKLSSTLQGLAALALAAGPEAISAKQRILVYTKTATFRHDSIPTAVEQIIDWGNTTWPYYETIHTQDESLFSNAGWLDQFDALVFVSTSGRVLTHTGQQNMIEYIQKGGGYMGVHEASDCVYEPWYNRLVGAQFNYHPEQCNAEMLVQDNTHPSVSWIKNGSWYVHDEMYNFNSNPRDYGRILTLAANESSYKDPVNTVAERAAAQGSPHPMSWYKQGNLLDSVDFKVGGDTEDTWRSIPASGGDGRMFYTALGHSNETWHDQGFKKHFYGGLGWVLNSTTIRSYSSDYLGSDNSWRVGQEWEQPEEYVDPFPEPQASEPNTGGTLTKKVNSASSLEISIPIFMSVATLAYATFLL